MSVKSVADYLLLRTPVARLDADAVKHSKRRAGPGKVSGGRIALSLVGIMLGIVASFYVSGIRVQSSSHPPTEQRQTAANRSLAAAGSDVSGTDSGVTIIEDLSLRRLIRVGLISLVICAVTYQALYFSLKLYQHEPALLILFVSFQYGYFWQSVVKAL
jgi:hypothetical protein